MMFVRTAGEQDLEAIKALLSKAWHAAYDGIYSAQQVDEITGQWHSIAALRAQLTQPHSEFLVADDGKLLGGVAFAVAVDDGRLVWLRQLYVLPDQQNKGIGTLLLDELCQCFPQARTIRLELERENVAALEFYRARGFLLMDNQLKTMADDLAMVMMEKPL
ncbi:GNAT family N-acetyltransferase [Aquamicrobium segne]|uniref:GNAT family N-acetyltransferase n=1 Tax=Aquamicrobium segne TaxID=469547 RepID=A0ABW0GZQ1_9HYPH